MIDTIALLSSFIISYTSFNSFTDGIIASTLNLLLSVVISVFLWYTIKGIQAEIASKDFPGISTHNLFWGLLTKNIPSDVISNMDRVHELRKKYGQLFKLRIGARIEIFVADINIARQMLRKHMDRSESYAEAKGSFEKSVVHLDGQEHNDRRKILNKSFCRTSLEQVFPQIQNSAQQVIKEWKDKSASNSIVRVDKDCSRMVINSISHAGFDHEFQPDDEMGPDRLLEVIEVLFKAHGLRMNLPRMFWPFINLYERSTVKLWRQFLTDRVIPNPKARESSVLGVMKEKYGNGNALLSEAHALFAAAHDTTLSTMNYVMLRLAKHQDIFAKVREEVDQLDWSSDNNITFEETNSEHLPYTSKVLREVLRLDNPSGFGVQRGITKDNEVYGGYHFPKGACVTFLIDAMGKDPSIWDDPDTFRPERWNEHNKSNFIGFGLGPRSCIGQELAWLEMMLLMIHVVRNLDLELAPGKDPDEIDRVFVMAAGPKGDVNVRMKPRMKNAKKKKNEW